MQRNIPDKDQGLQLINFPENQIFLTWERRLSDRTAYTVPASGTTRGGAFIAVVLLADLFGGLPAPGQIGFHVGASGKVVADHRVDVGQGNRRVLLGDFLGGRALLAGLDRRIERHAGSSDAQDAIPIGDHRHGFRQNGTACHGHGYFLDWVWGFRRADLDPGAPRQRAARIRATQGSLLQVGLTRNR